MQSIDDAFRACYPYRTRVTPQDGKWQLQRAHLRALHQALGDEAGEDVVNWMSEMELNAARMNDKIDTQFERVMTAIENLRTDLRAEIKTAIGAAEVTAARRHNELLKWSFVFWVGTVGAVAALAGFLR